MFQVVTRHTEQEFSRNKSGDSRAPPRISIHQPCVDLSRLLPRRSVNALAPNVLTGRFRETTTHYILDTMQRARGQQNCFERFTVSVRMRNARGRNHQSK